MQVIKSKLRRDGIIRGGGPHKAQKIPTGTEVFYIEHFGRYFWSGYLSFMQAEQVMKNLMACETAKRSIPFQTMLDWNFKARKPLRIARIRT